MRRFFVIAALLGACTPCADTCESTVLFVASPANDLVSASGCGQSAACLGTSPCSSLIVSPPTAGGVCTTVVDFSNGTSTSVTVDWGTVHSSGCCTTYDQSSVTTHVSAP